MRFTAAAVQFEPVFGEKAANLERLARLVRDAALAGARLAVLPEMAATGYCFRSREEIAPLVEVVPGGETTLALSALATDLNMYIVAGLAEVEPSTGAYYNTAVLVGPAGYIGKYRKTHAWVDDTRWARDGDLGVPVFETGLGRIGMIICMDAEYFEPARLAVLAGADIIAFPTNWLGAQKSWYARAMENGVYMVCADRWGEERGTRFAGNSVIIDPRGATLSLLSAGDGLVLADIDTEVARRSREEALALRRPQDYQDLLLSSHLFHWREAQTVPPGRPAVVAVGQASKGARMADQVRWADRMARESGLEKVDLVVFPLCDPGGTDLLHVAATLDCHVVWGARGADGEPSAWLAGPGGLLGEYRRGRVATFDLPWGRIGLLLGDDLRLPETARIIAKRGADLIAVPADWAGEWDRLLWEVRSFENNTALAVANVAGGSRIFGPSRVLRIPGAHHHRPEAAPGEGGIAIALVETNSEEIRAKELLRKLQPRWYDPLVRPEQATWS